MTCSETGCDAEVHASELCRNHYVKVWRSKQPECSIEGCQKQATGARGWCKGHYNCWRTTGSPIKDIQIRLASVCTRTKSCKKEVSIPFVWCPTHVKRANETYIPPNYAQAHKFVKSLRGFAYEHQCVENCGRQAEHWAYDHLDPEEVEGIEGPWSKDPSHYDPMCRKCHNQRDTLISLRVVTKALAEVPIEHRSAAYGVIENHLFLRSVK